MIGIDRLIECIYVEQRYAGGEEVAVHRGTHQTNMTFPMFPPEDTLSQVANIRQRSTPDEIRQESPVNPYSIHVPVQTYSREFPHIPHEIDIYGTHVVPTSLTSMEHRE